MNVGVNQEYKQNVMNPLVVMKKGKNYVTQTGEILKVNAKMHCVECLKSSNECPKSTLKLIKIGDFVKIEQEKQKKLLWIPCLGCNRVWNEHNCDGYKEHILACKFGHPYCWECVQGGHRR